MSKSKQKDNSTFLFKSKLRARLRQEMGADPLVIMETHGGYGALWDKCYPDIEAGIVFEKNPDKASALAVQRPTWAVYAGDCVTAIQDGVGDWLEVNLLDVDPYGSPWPILSAWFESERPHVDRLAIAVNDGLRQKVKMNGGWDVYELAEMVTKYGASVMYENYLTVCRELLTTKAAQRGCTLGRWAGYYCGHAQQMTHYAAILERVAQHGKPRHDVAGCTADCSTRLANTFASPF